MKTPKFDEFFSRLTNETHINTQSDLARALGLGRGAINHIKNKNKDVPETWIWGLHRQGYDMQWLLYGKGKPYSNSKDPYLTSEEFVGVPKVKPILKSNPKSNEPSLVNGDEGIFAFRGDWIAGKGDYKSMVLMEMGGNAMAPTLQHRDHVLVDTQAKNPISGYYYVFAVGDTVMVRRLEVKGPGEFRLVADNNDRAGVEVEGKVGDAFQIIGQVIWMCRELG